jgi:hypothetical protein
LSETYALHSSIQARQNLISCRPRLIATCPTLSAVVAAPRSKDISILMTVSPRPGIVGLTSAGGGFQRDLLGEYETLGYLKEGLAISHCQFITLPVATPRGPHPQRGEQGGSWRARPWR